MPIVVALQRLRVRLKHLAQSLPGHGSQTLTHRAQFTPFLWCVQRRTAGSAQCCCCAAPAIYGYGVHGFCQACAEYEVEGGGL